MCLRYQKAAILVSHSNSTKASKPEMCQLAGNYRITAVADVLLHVRKEDGVLVIFGVKSKLSEQQIYEEKLEYDYRKKSFANLTGIEKILVIRAVAMEQINMSVKKESSKRKHRRTDNAIGRPRKNDVMEFCLACQKEFSTKHMSEHRRRPCHQRKIEECLNLYKEL